MEWIIGIIVVLIVLGAMFGGSKDQRRTAPAQSRSSNSPSASTRRPYATVEEGGAYRDLSADEVAELFADIRGDLKKHRKTAKLILKLATRYEETGKLDDAKYAQVAWAETEVQNTITKAEALYDRLFFEQDSSSDRYYRGIEDLHEAEAEIEAARDDIVETKRAIEDGEFVPQKRVKPVKKPRKGSKPNIRMGYRSMSDNEREWEILIIARTGEASFQGWSFDHDREFNFNVAGVLWAEDLVSGQRISDFQSYLGQIAPLEAQ